ncbi:MAG: biotin/lipoyl-binding protein, partial [Kutzneria sp.]|nr:biotin/lipoyl-binding protein [Kutzneria sp.]
IQRRYQKIIEETPSPVVTPGTRERLCAAAAAAARSIGYVGAGTVEFLLSADGSVHFLEVNTRLQVEHPVTECVYGIDLVGWQLAIAEGARLPERPPPARGHAIEARLCAENPARDWQPCGGTLHRFLIPDVDARFTALSTFGLRLDSGVADGSVVGMHYDALLAKVIAWGPDRAWAARRLAAALASARIHGVITNRDLLVTVLRGEDFRAGTTDTGYLDRVGPDVLARGPLEDLRPSAVAAAVALAHGRGGRFPLGWRNVPSQPQHTSFLVGQRRIDVDYRFDRTGGLVVPDGLDLVCATATEVVLDVAGVRQRFDVTRYGTTVEVDSSLGAVRLTLLPRFGEATDKLAEGTTLAPMPGTVMLVAVEPGAQVVAGEELVVLEAMKMRHRVLAAVSGIVTDLPVRPGQQVAAGTVLAVVEPRESE